MTPTPSDPRQSLWTYYDRRVAQGVPGVANALAYWTGLGVQADLDDIVCEAGEVERLLRELEPATFVEVGAGPGTFTSMLPGAGLAMDQSDAALRRLRAGVAGIPVCRADAMLLPLADGAVDRFFAAHLYGLLQAGERALFLREARRVAHEVVILDAGRPAGVMADEWQERTLPDGSQYRIYRRHFDPKQLATEIGGHVLFAGVFYVLVRA